MRVGGLLPENFPHRYSPVFASFFRFHYYFVLSEGHAVDPHLFRGKESPLVLLKGNSSWHLRSMSLVRLSDVVAMRVAKVKEEKQRVVQASTGWRLLSSRFVGAPVYRLVKIDEGRRWRAQKEKKIGILKELGDYPLWHPS